MDTKKKEYLFKEFPPVTTEQWEAAIAKDLKGADYEKKLVKTTLDGIKTRPYYRDENLKGLEYLLNVKPGAFPFVRGDKSDNNWLIRQDFEITDFKEGNAKLSDALQKDVESLGLSFTTKEKITKQNLEELFKGVVITAVELNFELKSPILNFVEVLVEYLGDQAPKAFGSISIDPLSKLTMTGCDCEDKNCSYKEFPKKIFNKVSRLLPRFEVISIQANIFRNSGSNVVQELAFGLSMATDYITQATEQNISINKIINRIRFNFAAGQNYFLEIAKLRAARYLWARILEAYKPKSKSNAVMKIHSETEKFNKTIYDPYVNVLRTTTESMSAILGGTDSFTVLNFNECYDYKSGFSERIARNLQMLLKRESYFDKIVDPAAGSYYIENLTDQIIEKTWEIFLEVEEKGGYLKALEQGYIQEKVKEIANKKLHNLATRRETLLGTNQFPNFNEFVKDDIKVTKPCYECNKSDKIIEPLKEFRLAEEFEAMRLMTENSGKKRPKAFMFTYGNLTMRKARAQFSCNFFACAGFEVVDNNGFKTIQEGIQASKDADADIVVICSSDDEYAGIAQEILDGLKDKIVVIAGFPKNSMDDLKAMGVKHFVHVKVNILETLKQFQVELGIRDENS